MGLSWSSTYDQLVKLIELNDTEGIKKILSSVNKEEIREYCCDSCPEDQLNRSLLHHAVWKDDNAILQILMPYCEGESLEVYDAYGMTPLGAAISRGNYTAVKTLLEHSSQINCDQNRGYFLLRTAIYKNSTEIVELLIQHNSATKEQTTDEESGSLLHVACDLGNADIAKLLVDRGKIEINIEDKWKIRPVHVAAAKGRLNILKYLHDQGADLNAEDVFGNTPLGWAVFCKSLDCETYLKNFNAKYKDFVVPPPPDAESAKSVNEVSETTIEQLELETDGKKDIKKINNKTSIPVRKTVSTMVTKIEGATNPSFQMGDEKKEVTTV